MLIKAITGLIGLILAIAFFSVPAWKLRDPALAIVILIGIAMIVYEYWEQLHEKDEDDKGNKGNKGK
jgi:uncharacterized membrane protein